MKKWTWFRKSVAVLTVIAAGSVNAQTVKIALDSAKDLENSGTYVWAHAFTQYLQSKGMQVEEFERGALGNEAEKLDQLQQGLLEVSMSDTKAVAKFDAHILPMIMPYYFRDWKTVDKGLNGGVLAKINAGTTKQAVRVLGLASLGSAAGIFNTKHPVTSAKDMADLRMRALDETQIGVYKLWGTTGTIVAWDEVANALQTGIADGYLNPPVVPLMFGHTGFIKHYTDAQVALSSRAVLASESWFQGLNPSQQQVVLDAAAAATQINRQWLAGRGVELDQLRAAGVQVTTLSEQAWEEFKSLSQPLHSKVPPGVVKAWQDALAGR